MQLIGPLIAAVASAVAYGLAFPPTAWRPLMWVAVAPLLVTIRRAPRGRAVFATWVWITVMAYTVGDWFPPAIATYYDQSMLVGFAFFFGVSTLMAGIYYMAFAVAYQAMARRPGPLLPLLAAAAWTAAEFARVRLFTGNPWALSGYSQARMDLIVQVADVTGVYGISFVLAAVNAALAEVWLARRGGTQPVRRAAAGLGVVAVIVALMAGYGAARLWGSPPTSPVGPARVAVIQGNLDLGSQWRQEFYGENLDAYLRLTEQVLRERRPSLIVWPENALTFFLDDEPAYRRAIGSVLAPARAHLVSGGPRFVGKRNPVYYNSAFLVSPAGEITAVYDKEHLLPFAEYFPAPSLDFLRRRFGRVREFSAAQPSPPLPTPAGRAGVVICNEAMFGEIAAARVRDGAEFLLNLSNDTWLGDPKFSAIVFDTVSLRAVEQRRYLVRSSTSGPSAIVDPYGRVLVETDYFSRAVAAGTIQGRTDRTVYGRAGDLFALLCVLAVGVRLLRSGRAPGRR